jgi:hypothetical protein
MSTQFTNRQWRLPNNENKDKQSNYSMDYDGAVGTGITIGNFNDLGVSDTFSFSVWVKLTPVSDMRHVISNANLHDSGGFGLIQKNNSSGDTVFRFFVSGYTVNYIESTTALVSNQWYHIAVSYNNTNGAKMYINNGSPISGVTGQTLGNFTTNIVIGAAKNSTYPLNGQIDAVAIFNYTLSASQVTTLYGSSSTGIGNPMSLSPKPVAYYPLGDQDAFNGANYLVPNSSLKDYVFDFTSSIINPSVTLTGLGISNEFSVSLWANVDTITSYRGTLGATSGGSWVNGFGIYINGNKWNFFVDNWSASRVTSDTTITINTWFHLVGTFSSTGTGKFYINGTKEGTDFTGVTLDGLTNNFAIGNVYNGGGFFQGKMSNVQIWNKELIATEVETLYNNGSPYTGTQPQNSNLQGWWKLDASATYDGSNWTIPDDSSNSNTGTSSGMTQSALQQSDLSFKTSYSPYALDFDSASSDAITLGNTIGNGFTQITCSIWANISTSGLTQSSYRNFLVKFPSGSGSATPFELRCNPGNRTDSYNNKLFFRINTNSGGYGFTDTGFEFTEANKWHHLVGIYDGSNVKLFVNGVEYYSISANGTLNSNNNNATIGYHASTGNFNGKLSNASIWNTALTSAQISELFNEGVPSNLNNHSAYSNLVSWWQLGSNSSFNTNWTVLDEKGSNNGTSSNMTEDDIVDGVGSYANGLSSGMGGDEVIGDAPYSTANSLSVNMDVLDRVTDTPS